MRLRPDAPINRLDDDRFGRKRLARRLGDLIADLEPGVAFNIAITGPWGSGKTSFIGMLQDAIGNQRGLAFFPFNPWFFTGASDLAQRFYAEIGRTAANKRGADLRKVGRGLIRLGDSLSPLLPDPRYRMALGWLNHIIHTQPPTLAEAHGKLRIALDASPRRLVVLVDDIDRLRDDEVREVMRFVRMTGDLPNITFILAYDSQRIATQLGRDSHGERYVEKIVQLTIDLPLVRESLLTSDFAQILSESIPERLANHDRSHWPNHFHALIKPILQNSRDIRRVANALTLSIDLLGDEVDLADLVVLETIRVLRPGLFMALRDAGISTLTTGREPHGVGDTDPEVIKRRLQQLLDEAGDLKPYVERLLHELFPTTNAFLGGAINGTPALWRRDRRVAAPAPLAIYLHGGADSGEIGTPDVRRAIDLMTQPEAFENLLRSLPNGPLAALLERLEDYEYSYPPGADVAVAPILRQMHRLSAEAPGFFEFPERLRATRVVLRLLRSTPEDQRGVGVHATYSNLTALSERLELVELVGRREHVGHGLVPPEIADALEAELLSDLSASTGDSLVGEWDLIGLVLRASRWAGGVPEERRREWLANPRFVACLVLRGLGHVRDDRGNQQARLPWDEIAGVFEPEQWEAAAVNPAALDLLSENLLYLVAKYLSGWRPGHFEIDPLLSF